MVFLFVQLCPRHDQFSEFWTQITFLLDFSLPWYVVHICFLAHWIRSVQNFPIVCHFPEGSVHKITGYIQLRLLLLNVLQPSHVNSRIFPNPFGLLSFVYRIPKSTGNVALFTLSTIWLFCHIGRLHHQIVGSWYLTHLRWLREIWNSFLETHMTGRL